VAGIGGFAFCGWGWSDLPGDDTWAPLTLIAVSVSLWAVLLVRRTASASGQLTAAGLYALGTVGFGALAGSPGAVAVGVGARAPWRRHSPSSWGPPTAS